MLSCEECGAELPDNALFCGHCGRKTASEKVLHTNVNNAPIEDKPISPPAISMALNDSQDSTSENEEEEKLSTPDSPTENNENQEEQSPSLTFEDEKESQAPDLISENEIEEQTQQDNNESTGLMPVDTNPEPAILANQLSVELPQNSKTSRATQETLSPYASTQKPESRPVSRCLLFFLAGLVVIVGVVAALVGYFHVKYPGISESSKSQSSSSSNEIIKSTGSALTASICINSSTPSTSGTNDGTGFTLNSSSGCSTVIAAPANSLCLIFSSRAGASHQFIFDVSNVEIGSMSYHLVLGVVDYTGSATYEDARHISVGLSEGSTGRNFSWLYHSGSVTINNNEKSGTADVILVAVKGGNILHLFGNWACGRQIKNT